MKRPSHHSPRLAKLRLKAITEASRTIRALRLLKGLSRQDAGRLVGVSAKAFERIENGRGLMKPERIEKYVSALGYTMLDFRDTAPKAREVLAGLEKSFAARPRPPRKIRRNLHKIITKETRVIRILRRRSKLTQYQAAATCGYANSIFGQIENGRIELPRDRIEHIVCALGYAVLEFDRLMKAEILRDEMIEQCTQYLESLEDNKLDSAQLIIKTLMK